ncbi:MAG: hypothetical protein HRU36_01850 [Rickettsiales bacterium]|nr:hypothetical protein [Rickettsiales bacterium]
MNKDSIIKKGIKLALDEKAGKKLKIVQVDNYEEFKQILDNNAFLQGYHTGDKSCLPFVDLVNYYIDAAIMPIVAMDSSISICELATVCNTEQKQELGEIGCVATYLTVNQGKQCIFDEYSKIPYLTPKKFSLFEIDGHDHSNHHLYCLYGEEFLAGNNITPEDHVEL